MTFSVKPGVEISDLSLTMARAIPRICDVFAAFGYRATITSGRDGNHMEGSAHYMVPGRALDWRTWENDQGAQIRPEIKVVICREIERELPHIQAIPERTHIHTEERHL